VKNLEEANWTTKQRIEELLASNIAKDKEIAELKENMSRLTDQVTDLRLQQVLPQVVAQEPAQEYQQLGRNQSSEEVRSTQASTIQIL